MKINKQEVLFATEVVVGTAIGLFLRKKMVEKGMIKSFFTPNILIRKPGTFRKCQVCDTVINAKKFEEEFDTKPTKDESICSWACLHAVAGQK